MNDLGIATGEVFPRVTALAFQGPGKTPFMISWRKYVERLDEAGVYHKSPATDNRFAYLQPDEVLLARDIMNKQIVDTQGVKVVQVLGMQLAEDIIAWSYLDLLERSTKQIKLAVSHKTLSELHPADIADIIEQLDPRLRTQVFAQLDTEQAAEAITELDDDELMTACTSSIPPPTSASPTSSPTRFSSRATS